MGNATLAQAPRRAGLAQKGKGKGRIAKAKQSKAWARDCLAKHRNSRVWRRCGAETKRTATEKLRLPRTCAGEAGQSHGEEVLYNALELNRNRFYKKKETNKNESTY